MRYVKINLYERKRQEIKCENFYNNTYINGEFYMCRWKYK